MTKRIFRSILGVSLAVLLASLVLIVGVLHGYFQDRVSGELESLAEYIAHGVEENGTDYLTEDLPGSYRITWVASDGTVLYDTRTDTQPMENHGQREEIREALILGKGHAVRYSDTLSQQTLYAAQRLADGTVLRVSSAQYSVWVLVLQALQPVALMMLLAFILAMALASRVARQLVEPINAIDLNDPAGSETYEELTPLLSKLRSQQRQIQRQMRDLKRRQEEFTAITENMSEGFLVIDQETRVLTYNSAVLRLLYAQVPTEEGESVYALNREAGFRRCVEEALAGRRCEQLLEKDDDCRQIIASPVEQDGQIAGAVLVILDVTEKEQRERLAEELKRLLLPRDPNDEKSVVLEIRGGVGGEEGALFAADLLRMYTMYAERRGWQLEIVSQNVTELGGVKEVCATVEGDGAWSRLKFEAGTHRVQRVPETESGGRIQTSAATVAVMPEAEETELSIDPKDLQIDTFRSSGAGGQHVNKTESAIRITHLPTGTVVECQDERSQYKNKDRAMKILRSKLYEAEQARQNAEIAATRRSQVGTGDRSGKIRTYNFPQNRVTDHRLTGDSKNFNLAAVINGDLDALIDALTLADQTRRLQEGHEKGE